MTGRRVYVVDDDAAVRDSLVALLEVAGHSATAFGGAEEFLSTIGTDAEGCLLVDLRMPGMDGLALQSAVQDRQASLVTVVMTGDGDIPSAVEAMKRGALDFIEKPVDAERLERLLETAFARLDRVRAARPSAMVPQELSRLSKREREVLQRLARGFSNKQAAQELGISHRTVEVHRARIMEKLGADSVSDLVRVALAAGLLKP